MDDIEQITQEQMLTRELLASVSDTFKKRMTAKKHFDVTLLHPFNMQYNKEPLFEMLQAFHCVDWADMGPEVTKTVQDAAMFLVKKHTTPQDAKA